MADCLTPEEIGDLLAEVLPPGQKTDAQAHLATCDKCRQAFDGLKSDLDLSGDIRQAYGTATALQPARPTGLGSGDGLSAPESIAGYEILHEIHRGSQGVVYKAVQRATKRTVALKVLLQGSYASARQRHRFEREIDLVASLQHPNIVTIYDSGVTQGRHYFAMEYVHGQSLDEYLAKRAGPSSTPAHLAIDETLRLFAKICAAVNYAHQRGVIHRDLKPGNIRIDAQGEPRVLDFGLAKAAGSDVQGGAPVTVTGEFMGTLAYASPEQTKGDPGLIDIRTDVYALGVILYELLTGRLPYNTNGPIGDVLKNVAEAEPKKPSTLRREIDDEVETIVLKTLSKERERRYQSAGTLCRDVQHYLGGQPIEAKRDSISYWARKLARRWVSQHQWAALLFVAVTAAALLWVAVFKVKEPLGRTDVMFDRMAQQSVGETLSDDVVVLSLDDATYNAIPRLSAELALTHVSQKNVKSWRAMHGAMMRQLAHANPRVVVWDIKFSSHQPAYDGELVAGIEALQEAGAKVIVAASAVDEQGLPVLSPPIIARIDGWGLIDLRLTGRREVVRGTLLAVTHPPRDPIPSLSLAAREAARHADRTPPIYVWNKDDQYYRLGVVYSRRAQINPQLVQSSEVYEHVATDVRNPHSRGIPKYTDCSNRHALYTDTVIPSAENLARHTES